MAIHHRPEVETATRSDERRATDTLVLAFGSDPIIRWLYPNPHDYLQHFPEFVERYAGQAYDHGTTHYVQDFSAVALWLPPEVHPDEEALGELFQNTLSETRREQALSVLEQLDGYLPSEPFWRLPVIGVDPTRQRRGLGSVLLEHALDGCDRDGTPAYLESSNPENVSLYVRHGFEILGTIHGDAMPPLIPMLREPQTRETGEDSVTE